MSRKDVFVKAKDGVCILWGGICRFLNEFIASTHVMSTSSSTKSFEHWDSAHDHSSIGMRLLVMSILFSGIKRTMRMDRFYSLFRHQQNTTAKLAHSPNQPIIFRPHQHQHLVHPNHLSQFFLHGSITWWLILLSDLHRWFYAIRIDIFLKKKIWCSCCYERLGHTGWESDINIDIDIDIVIDIDIIYMQAISFWSWWRISE